MNEIVYMGISRFKMPVFMEKHTHKKFIDTEHLFDQSTLEEKVIAFYDKNEIDLNDCLVYVGDDQFIDPRENPEKYRKHVYKVKVDWRDWRRMEYVDLGLSVNWATFNVGAYWCKPGERGRYTNIDGMKWFHVEFDKLILPTIEQWNELKKNCTWEFKEGGVIVTSKKKGYTDKSIILPVTGYGQSTYKYETDKIGYYWSSNRSTKGYHKAFCFHTDGINWCGEAKIRDYYKIQVRPVQYK